MFAFATLSQAWLTFPDQSCGLCGHGPLRKVTPGFVALERPAKLLSAKQPRAKAATWVLVALQDPSAFRRRLGSVSAPAEECVAHAPASVHPVQDETFVPAYIPAHRRC